CREYEGEMVEVRTNMGRRVRCTPDHPFVVADPEGKALAVRQASELTRDDWLPVAQGAPPVDRSGAVRLDLSADQAEAELVPGRVTVHLPRRELAGVGARRIQPGLAHRSVARSHDIWRTGALRLTELRAFDLPLDGVSLGTTRYGTHVPSSLVADQSFWRVVGLYIADGRCSADGSQRRLQWAFHPSRRHDLVDEVAGFWRRLGVECDVGVRPTSTTVTVSSRLLAGWWLGSLGLGADCYEQRVPDLVWDRPEAEKRALLSGIWRGDWSSANRGPDLGLEFRTVSRLLADGLLRLLGDLGVTARLEVGRAANSTFDTYRLVGSGPEDGPVTIGHSLHRRSKAPTGYRRSFGASWARIEEIVGRRSRCLVYSLEVPDAHTFVTTGGLVVHNCFPKDISSLKQLAGNSGYHFQLLSAVIEVNELQKRRVIGKLKERLGDLHGKRVALLGLAFKPGTDDMREAPSLVLAARLLAEGAEVVAWDPIADSTDLPPQVKVCDSIQQAVEGADAAVIVTEWPELKGLASAEVRELMRRPLIVDGRNLLDPAQVRAAGFVYEGIGRPQLDPSLEAPGF
ncbi:MAG: UDP binding domain-containing protein, partial [Acidimicrobiia bacterium]